MDNQPAIEAGTTHVADLPGPADTTGVEFDDALLADLVGRPAPQANEPAPDGSPPPAPSLNDQWTAAGFADEDLFKGTVKLSGDNGTATLQELKDDATAYRTGQVQLAEFVDERTEFANEKLRHMQELTSLVASIPQEHISEDLKAAGAAYVQRDRDVQDRILLAALPAWKDQAVKDQDHLTMQAMTVNRYGAPTAWINTPMPAWLKNCMHDYAQLLVRIDGIKTKQRTPASKGTKSQPAADPTRTDGVNSALAAGDKVGAITQLLIR